MIEFLSKIEEKIKRNKKDYRGEIYRLIGVACYSWEKIENKEEKEQAKERLKEVIEIYNKKYK